MTPMSREDRELFIRNTAAACLITNKIVIDETINHFIDWPIGDDHIFKEVSKDILEFFEDARINPAKYDTSICEVIQ